MPKCLSESSLRGRRVLFSSKLAISPRQCGKHRQLIDDRGLRGQPDHVRRRVLPEPVLGSRVLYLEAEVTGHSPGRYGFLSSTPFLAAFLNTSRQGEGFLFFPRWWASNDTRLNTLPAYDFEEAQ